PRRRKIMRTQRRISRALSRWACAAVSTISLATSPGLLSAAEPGAPKTPSAEELALGRELFLREWLPNDPRSHGGDGLGPVFNDSSCVACHNLGGPGGGGPASKNVDILSALPLRTVEVENVETTNRNAVFLENTIRSIF